MPFWKLERSRTRLAGRLDVVERGRAPRGTSRASAPGPGGRRGRSAGRARRPGGRWATADVEPVRLGERPARRGWPRRTTRRPSRPRGSARCRRSVSAVAVRRKFMTGVHQRSISSTARVEQRPVGAQPRQLVGVLAAGRTSRRAGRCAASRCRPRRTARTGSRTPRRRPCRPRRRPRASASVMTSSPGWRRLYSPSSCA